MCVAGSEPIRRAAISQFIPAKAESSNPRAVGRSDAEDEPRRHNTSARISLLSTHSVISLLTKTQAGISYWIDARVVWILLEGIFRIHCAAHKGRSARFDRSLIARE